MPAGLRAIASIGGLLVSVGLLLTVAALWPAISRSWTGWHVPLLLLTLKAVLGLGMILPVTAQWAQLNALRIFYLHVLLMGFITLGLVVAAREVWGRVAVPGHRWLVISVLALLLSLVPLTGFWPSAWSSRWALQMAAVVSLGPVIVMAVMLVTLIVREVRTESELTAVVD